MFCWLDGIVLAMIGSRQFPPGPAWKALNFPIFRSTEKFSHFLGWSSIGLLFILATTGRCYRAWFRASEQRARRHVSIGSALSNTSALCWRCTNLSSCGTGRTTLGNRRLCGRMLFVGRSQWASDLCGLKLAKIRGFEFEFCAAGGYPSNPAIRPPDRRNYRDSGSRSLRSTSVMLLADGPHQNLPGKVAVRSFLWVLPLATFIFFSFIICSIPERWYQRGLFHPSIGRRDYF